MAARYLVIQPNASMSNRLAMVGLTAAATPLLVTAVVLCALGYWPMLPFGAAALLFFAAALWIALLRNDYREVITIDHRVVRIERGRLETGPRQIIELNRAWLRVSVSPGPCRNSPRRLELHSLGRSIEVGQQLTDGEREDVAARLKSLTGCAWGVAS